MPKRIQLRRTKGWRKPPGAKSVARPTWWGNPFAVGDFGVEDRAVAVAKYREWIMASAQGAYLAKARAQLAGNDLACWCPLDQPCHADVLLELVNEPEALLVDEEMI